MNVCARCGLRQPTSELRLCPRCLLSDDEPEAPEAPPGLVLKEEIGRGGMGRVFRARQIRLGRDVAVKFLATDELAEPNSEARFEREARTLARLSHPNIVSVHDFGVLASGQRYFVMELVEGGTLRSRLPLGEAQALTVCRELCHALAYAHERGVVHRDIKPDNVLFDAEGHAKLADFGIARLVSSDTTQTLTHPLHVLGTPGYVAPEALRGAPPHPSMDVFAVGALLDAMLREPREAGVPELSASVGQLVQRATQPSPERRPQNRAELLAELERLVPRGKAELGDPGRVPAQLPPDEQSWQRGVALTLAGATALSLHAVLVSVTPRAMPQSELTAFLVFGATALPDGRVMTQARFETMPTLLAAGGWAIGLFAYGFLRRHWRKEQLELSLPQQRLQGTRALIAMAVLLNMLWLLRLGLEAGVSWFTIYVPVIGGLLELVMLYLFWSAVLESLRIKRALSREPLLWLGLLLSLLPPTVSFFTALPGDAP